MSNTVTRKCNGCENPIIYNEDTTNGIVLYKGKYYHTDCFNKAICIIAGSLLQLKGILLINKLIASKKLQPYN